MEQTAMQEMIEWAISLKDKEQQCIDWIAIKNKAEELLAMEKEQMIDFAAELSYGIGVSKEEMKKVAEQYYNETYNK
jgi:hypothetical protein